MKTAVLIHGCHLQAEGWEKIVWGDPKSGVFGRVPKGILEAMKSDADTIIFSTGASKKDGLLEGEYILKYAFDHMADFAAIGEARGWDLAKFTGWLKSRAVMELTSVDTKTEVIASARIAHERGAKRLILVSSPSHIFRCHKEAIAALRADCTLNYFLDNLYATASDTCFEGTDVNDVVIIEPPHRGDMPKVPFHTTAKGIFQFLRNPSLAFAFNEDWLKLIDSYKKQMQR